jgi:hypothetical protein
MKLEGLLPCSKEPTSSPHPKLDESNNTVTFYFSNIHFNIILQLTSSNSTWSLCLYTFPSPRCPARLIHLDWIILIMFVKSKMLSCHFTHSTHWIGGWGGLQGRSGNCGEDENLELAGIRTPAVQPVTHRSTDWAIPTLWWKVEIKILFIMQFLQPLNYLLYIELLNFKSVVTYNNSVWED